MDDARYYELSAIILRGRDYKEHDKLVTLYSLEQGRQTVLAKGVKKPTGKLRGLVQPFTQARLTLTKGRGSLPVLTQGEVERPFVSLRQDLAKIAYASYFAELVYAALPEGKVNRAAFLLVLAAFALLDMDADAAQTARYFELHLLDALGLAPRLSSCLGCERGIPGGRFYLVPERGGLLCATCSQAPEELLLSPGAVRSMQHLMMGEPQRLLRFKMNSTIQQELERALAHYLDYHLERASKARGLLRQLLVE